MKMSLKVFDHIFISGSITTVIAALVVPLGFFIGKNGGILFDRHPRWSYAGTILGSLALWIVAKFLG